MLIEAFSDKKYQEMGFLKEKKTDDDYSTHFNEKNRLFNA
jgi:hypothetical protein